jgi:glucokinase
MRTTHYALGIDLGGTKTAVALVSTEGAILHRLTEPTVQTGSEAGITQILHLVRDILDETGVAQADVLGVGIGLPAVIDQRTDLVRWGPNLPGWHDVPLRAILERELRLPVRVEYDGHTAVLAEWWQGAARGCHSAAVVIIGTGVGGGIIVEGQLIRGLNGMAGAVGWFPMTSHSPDLNQDARAVGHWDSLVGGPGIVRRTRALLSEYPTSSLARRSPLAAHDVFDADANGDPLARRIIDDTADMVGLGIAGIVSLLNPEIIILGGGIGALRGERLIPRAAEVVRRWSQPVSADSVVITASRLRADGGTLGAAYAVISQLQPHSLHPL